MTQLSRRRFLGGVSLTGLGMTSIGLAGLGLGACTSPKQPPNNATCQRHASASKQYAFYGQHQAGIITPSQRHIYLLVADLHSLNIDDITTMFKNWTRSAASLCQGNNHQAYGDNPHIPPTDTGEADSLSAWGLTLTFGISPSFLSKLGLSQFAPPEFVDLPHFAKDQLKDHLSGGDICIQACSDDPQVAFHAVRQLVRQARSLITLRYSRMGFTSSDEDGQTPRNLFGFKDGTANQEVLSNADQHIWVQHPNWLAHGSYMVVRTIAMHLETWDRTSLTGQEETFARHRDTGAPLGQTDEFAPLDIHATHQGKPIIPQVAHSALAKGSNQQILRRSYSYADGIDPKTGQFDAGLLFISFQKSPKQFIDIQNALGTMDKMTEYTTHIGSGLFACFGGVREGEYLGQALFELAKS